MQIAASEYRADAHYYIPEGKKENNNNNKVCLLNSSYLSNALQHTYDWLVNQRTNRLPSQMMMDVRIRSAPSMGRSRNNIITFAMHDLDWGQKCRNLSIFLTFGTKNCFFLLLHPSKIHAWHREKTQHFYFQFNLVELHFQFNMQWSHVQVNNNQLVYSSYSEAGLIKRALRPNKLGGEMIQRETYVLFKIFIKCTYILKWTTRPA